MEQTRAKRTGLLAMKLLTPVGVLVIAALLAPSRTATAEASSEAAAPPRDGKYANVTVEGRTVAMVHVMNGGAVVLVDVDGAKPRTWEEQFKRKGSLPNGAYDVHKTNVNGNETFEDDPIDRQGTWFIDGNGNISLR
jgi:hypothetical protein